MTSPTIHILAYHPIGRAVRAAIAIVGMIAATILLTIAPLSGNGSWALVVVGLGLTAASVRTAVHPTSQNVAVLVAAVLAVPLAAQFI